MSKGTEHTTNNEYNTHDQKPINPPTVPFKPAHLRKSFKKNKIPKTSENTTPNIKSYTPDSTETLVPLLNDDGDKSPTQPRTSPALDDVNKNISIIEDDKSILDIGKTSNRYSKQEKEVYPVKKNKNIALDGEMKEIDGPKENKSKAASTSIKTKIADNKCNIGKEKTQKDYNPIVDESQTLLTSSITTKITDNKSNIVKEKTPKAPNQTVDKSDTLPMSSITCEITNNKSNVGKEKTPKDYNPTIDNSDALPTSSITSKITDNKSNLGKEKTPKDYNATVDKLDTLSTSSITSTITDNKSNIGKEKTPKDYNPTVDKSDTLPTPFITSEKLEEMQSPIKKLNPLELQNRTEVDTHMNTSPKGKNKNMKAKNLMSKNVIPKDENSKDQIEVTNKSVLGPHENNELPSLNLKSTEYNNKPKSRIEQELDFQYQENILKAHNTAERGTEICTPALTKSLLVDTNDIENTSEIRLRNANNSNVKSNKKLTNSRIETRGEKDLSLTAKNSVQLDTNDDEISPSPVGVKLHTKKHCNKDNSPFKLPPDRTGMTNTTECSEIEDVSIPHIDKNKFIIDKFINSLPGTTIDQNIIDSPFLEPNKAAESKAVPIESLDKNESTSTQKITTAPFDQEVMGNLSQINDLESNAKSSARGIKENIESNKEKPISSNVVVETELLMELSEVKRKTNIKESPERKEKQSKSSNELTAVPQDVVGKPIVNDGVSRSSDLRGKGSRSGNMLVPIGNKGLSDSDELGKSIFGISNKANNKTREEKYEDINTTIEDVMAAAKQPKSESDTSEAISTDGKNKHNKKQSTFEERKNNNQYS